MTTGNWHLQLLNRSPPKLRGNGCGFCGSLRLQLRLCGCGCSCGSACCPFAMLCCCFAVAVTTAVLTAAWLTAAWLPLLLAAPCNSWKIDHGCTHFSVALARIHNTASGPWKSAPKCTERWLWEEAHNISLKAFMRTCALYSILLCKQKLCSQFL